MSAVSPLYPCERTSSVRPATSSGFSSIGSLPGFETAMLMTRGVGIIEPFSSQRQVDKSAGVDRLGQEALRRHRQHRLFDRGRRSVLSFQHLAELFDFGRDGLLEFRADMIEKRLVLPLPPPQ